MMGFFSSNVLFCCGIWWLLFMDGMKSYNFEPSLSLCEIERLLKPIVSSPYERTIQSQALRNRLLNLIRHELGKHINNADEKRSMSVLPTWNGITMKRNIQSLAREGYLTSKDDSQEEADVNLKRSIQSLARTNEFPQYQTEPPKRSTSSLARNRELSNGRSNLGELLYELYEKRNIGNTAQNYNFPLYGKGLNKLLTQNGDLNTQSDNGERNIVSMGKIGKHNVVTRIDTLPNPIEEYTRNIAFLTRGEDTFLEKRNVDYAITDKHGSMSKINNDSNKKLIETDIKPTYKRFSFYIDRTKREADYYDDSDEEYIEPAFQYQNSREYEELQNDPAYSAYRTNKKRFLGRLPQMGKPKTTPSPKIRRIKDFY